MRVRRRGVHARDRARRGAGPRRVSRAGEDLCDTLQLDTPDFGRPFNDLELSYRPTDLRSVIDQANAGRKPLVVRNVEWALRGGDVRWIDVQATPLYSGAQVAGVAISFDDVTAFHHLHRELEKSNAELEGAYEELQSTNEELETTNEELQSTVEEFETTNEELQSTNEELETMNEELQSTNEELTTINDELRRRSDELNDLNVFMEAVLGSLRGGVAVLDTELRVEVWNEKRVRLVGRSRRRGPWHTLHDARHRSSGADAREADSGLPFGGIGGRNRVARGDQPSRETDHVRGHVHANATASGDESPGRDRSDGGERACGVRRCGSVGTRAARGEPVWTIAYAHDVERRRQASAESDEPAKAPRPHDRRLLQRTAERRIADARAARAARRRARPDA